jgi:hypothetical protein
MACSHSTSCPLFAQFQLDSTLRSWKIMYCDSDTRSRNCHRFKLSESGHTVPLNLLPNGTMLDIDVGSSAGQCGPARAPATPAPAIKERVSAPSREPAVAVAERVAPAAAAPAPAVRSASTHPPAVPQRVAPTAAAPAMPAQPGAPAAAQRARSILDRLLGRKG